MIGPPGTGKTMLARTIPALLPPLSEAESLTATIVASVSGEGPIRGLVRTPPFRAPHHTSSYAAIVGGGRGLSPGEVTRADHGVLFLDELAEFSRDVLEALRQPLEDGRVTIVRASGAATLPARFQLVAATNPCPCGHAGEEDRCICAPGVPERYVGRISGPLRDRIDVWVTLARMPAAAMVDAAEPESSAVVAARIAAARARQQSRARGAAQRPADGPGAPGDRRAAGDHEPPARRARRRRAAVGPRDGAAPARRADDRGPGRVGRGRDRAPRGGGPVAAADEPLAVRAGGVTVLGVGGDGAGELDTDVRSRPAPGRGAAGRPAISTADREALAVLLSVHGMGPLTLARLVDGLGSPAAILERRRATRTLRRSSSPRASIRMERAARCRKAVAEAIVEAAARRDAILADVARSKLRVVALGDPDYPSRLVAIEIPPPALFVRGTPRAARRRSTSSRSWHAQAEPCRPTDREPDRHGARSGRGDGRLRPRHRDRWSGPRGVRHRRRADGRVHRRRPRRALPACP